MLRYIEERNPDIDWHGYVFSSRYAAYLARRCSRYHSSDDVIVRVCGGYVIMSQSDYETFRNQR